METTRPREGTRVSITSAKGTQTIPDAGLAQSPSAKQTPARPARKGDVVGLSVSFQAMAASKKPPL
jgi:hypothetical protein